MSWASAAFQKLLQRHAAWAPNPLLGMPGLEGKPLHGEAAPSVRQSWCGAPTLPAGCRGALLPPRKCLHLLSTARGPADPALGPALHMGDMGDRPRASSLPRPGRRQSLQAARGWAGAHGGRCPRRYPEVCPVGGGQVTPEDLVLLCSLLEPPRDYWTRGAGSGPHGSAKHRSRCVGHLGGRREGFLQVPPARG